MKAKDIYKAAPRKSGQFDINGLKVDIIEPSLKDRVDWSNLSDKYGNDSEYIFGFLISRCCQQFNGEQPENIVKNLNPEVLMDLGNAILGMVDKKKG